MEGEWRLKLDVLDLIGLGLRVAHDGQRLVDGQHRCLRRLRCLRCLRWFAGVLLFKRVCEKCECVVCLLEGLL